MLSGMENFPLVYTAVPGLRKKPEDKTPGLYHNIPRISTTIDSIA